MSNPLEITGDDIARLDDTAFRTLIAYLCEADVRKAGISSACVDASGHQNAGDGGLDVKVCIPINPPRYSFIPRRISGFQVKTSPMPASAIKKEMRPRGKLRPIIAELAEAGGAYLIVSSKDNLSQTSQSTRIRAMKTALGKAKGRSKILLQVFDRNKVAQWVRSHPAIVAWVRSQVGRPISGWQPYDNWSNSPVGIADEYLLDNKVRFHDRTSRDMNGSSALEGIRNLRTLLSSPRQSVRIAGLSGTGKTRFVQALFDERIAENALNRFAVIYTDISHEPNPNPVEMATWLASSGERILLIVDNCPQELHHTLSAVCKASRSALSLVTVEYDVQDDRPAETSVFKLEPASDHVIDELVFRRFPHITDVDRGQIAKFSGGNARIAIAIAGTIQIGESIGPLRDANLFDRLFLQRTPADRAVRVTAELCSLVYSFDGEDVSADSELARLAGLKDRSAHDVFSDLAGLRRRDLLQARSQWRAILPPALANSLATTALESIPVAKLIQTMLFAPSRLLKSFTRRLNYLPDTSTVKSIALQLLGEIDTAFPNLSELGIAMFENLAPLAMEESLRIFEQASMRHGVAWYRDYSNHSQWTICRLLWHLSYEEKCFTKACRLLAQIAVHEEKEASSPGRHFLKLLFQSRFSGTLASPPIRGAFLLDLVESEDVATQSLGIDLLQATLEVNLHGTYESYEFGTHSRDYGYFPESRQEVVDWFSHFLLIVQKLASSNSLIASRVRDLLSEQFFGLWVNAELYEELSRVVQEIDRVRRWPDGWATIRNILQYRNLSTECIRAATALDQLLAPNSVIEKVRLVAIARSPEPLEIGCIHDRFESYSEATERSQRAALEIGVDVASNHAHLLEALLPEIIRSDGPRTFSFARGLIQGSSEPDVLFDRLVGTYCAIPRNERKVNSIYGILSGLAARDARTASIALERLSAEKEFAPAFPELQLNHPIDDAAVTRLHCSIATGLVNGSSFRALCYPYVQKRLGDARLVALLTKVENLPGGYEIVVDATAARLKDEQQKGLAKGVEAFGRRVLSRFKVGERGERRRTLDYYLAKLVSKCLPGRGGKRAAAHVCRVIASGLATYSVSHHDYPRTLQSLAVAHPSVLLDEMLDTERSGNRLMANATYLANEVGNPFDHIPDAEVLAWCDKNPSVRYSKIAAAILPFESQGKSEPLQWRPLALEIVNRSSNVVGTLAVFANSLFEFNSWSGSRVAIWERRVELLKFFFDHADKSVCDAAKDRYEKLQKQITEERADELSRERRAESFE